MHLIGHLQVIGGLNKMRKDKLKLIYDKVNIKQTAKANDLEKWFEIKEVSMFLQDGKKVHGFEIIAIKKT